MAVGLGALAFGIVGVAAQSPSLAKKDEGRALTFAIMTGWQHTVFPKSADKMRNRHLSFRGAPFATRNLVVAGGTRFLASVEMTVGTSLEKPC